MSRTSLLLLCGILLVGLYESPATHAQDSTRLVRDIRPGSESSTPDAATPAGGLLYFTAEDGTHGQELWASDGESAWLVEDLNTGSNGSHPNELTAFKGALFFAAGDELWSTQGDAVSGFAADTSWYDPRQFTVAENRLFFIAESAGYTEELWATDGATAFRIDLQGVDHSYFDGDDGDLIQGLTSANGSVYFSAEAEVNGTEVGTELWRSDGSTAHLVGDLRPGSEGSSPQVLTRWKDMLLFSADDGTNGRELWAADESGTRLVQEIHPGAGDADISRVRPAGELVYFLAEDGTHGRELWASDGQSAWLVKDIRSGPESSNARELTLVGDTLFFRAEDETHGEEIWASDGQRAWLVEDLSPGPASAGSGRLTAFDDRLFFTATDVHGTELYVTRGDSARLVRDIAPGLGHASPEHLKVLGDLLYFEAYTDSLGHELWASDGRTAWLVKDVWPGRDSGAPNPLAQAGGTAYFEAADPEHGRELWSLGSGSANRRPVVQFRLVIPDPDLTKRDPSEVEVMEGGRFARYYRMIDSDGEVYTKGDGARIGLISGQTVEPDKNGLIRISASVASDEPFSNITSVPHTIRDYTPVERVVVNDQLAGIDGSGPQFDVRLIDRSWNHAWETTSETSTEASVVGGLKGRSTGTLDLVRDEAGGLRMRTSFENGFGAIVGASALSAEVGVGSAECLGFGGELLLIQRTGRVHEFEHPFTRSPEAAGLILLNLFLQQRLQSASSTKGDFLKYLLKQLMKVTSMDAYEIEQSASTGLEASTNGNLCNVEFLGDAGTSGSGTEGTFTVAGASLDASAGMNLFHRSLTTGQFVDARESGFEASISFEPTLQILISLLDALGVKERTAFERTVSMKAVKSMGRDQLERLVSTLGSKDRSVELALQTARDTDDDGLNDFLEIVEHVSESDPIASIVKQYRGSVHTNRLSWPKIAFETKEMLQHRLYGEFLRSVRELAGQVRLEYSVNRTSKLGELPAQLPLGLALGPLNLGITRTESFREKKTWLNERGVIQCFGSEDAAPSRSCAFAADSSNSPTAVYWTRRYPKDEHIEDEGRPVEDVVSDLLTSLGPKVKQLDRLFEQSSGYLRAGLEKVLDTGDALVRFFTPESGKRIARKGSKRLGKVHATLVSWKAGERSGKVARAGEGPSRELNLQTIGNSHQLFPRGTELTEPAKLVLRYDENDLPPEVDEQELDIFKWSRSTGEWTTTRAELDANADELRTDITTFTTYVIGTATGPKGPPSLQVQSGKGSTLLSWSPMNGDHVRGFHVYRTDQPLGSYERITDTPVETHEYEDSTAEVGRTYRYRITTVDTAGREGTFSPQAEIFLYPDQIQTSLTRPLGDGSSPDDYRLVALPGHTDLPLSKTLDGRAGRDWQAWIDDGTERRYLQAYDGSEAFTFRPGRGFWLTGAESWQVKRSFPTVDLRGDTSAVINLQKGWNIVSNPTDKTVPWNRVQSEYSERLQPIWQFDGGAFSRADSFRSARDGVAYYFFNHTSRDSLAIPYPGAPGVRPVHPGSGKKRESKAETPSLVLAARPSASTNRDTSSVSRIGIRLHPEAASGLDPRDIVAPPERFTDLSLRLVPNAQSQSDSRMRALKHEQRPPTGDGQSFPVILETNRDSGPIRLEMAASSNLEGRSVRLVERATGTIHELTPSHRTVTLRTERDSTRLELLLGTPEYVKREIEQRTAESLKMDLSPNPVGESGTISYRLPSESPVRVVMYDLLGRQVAVIEERSKKAGRYQISFQTEDLASGIYFVQLRTERKTLVRKITIAR